MNAPDMHMAALAAYEHQTARDELLIEADGGRTYREMLDSAFEKVIESGEALQDFDSHSEAVYSSADLLARLLWAHRKRHPIQGFVAALHDAIKAKHEAFYGEEIRERAEAAILTGGGDAD